MLTGQLIAKLRTEAGLSQALLAERLYVSRELVSKWETGKSRPDLAALKAMAEIFGVPPETLIDRDAILSEELAGAFPPGYAADAQTLKRALNAFLGTLNERDRSVFVRRYYMLETPAEIGAAYGLRENYVRTVLMRVRKKLSKFLKEDRL